MRIIFLNICIEILSLLFLKKQDKILKKKFILDFDKKEDKFFLLTFLSWFLKKTKIKLYGRLLGFHKVRY